MCLKQFYHDSSSFKLISLADKCADLEFVRNVASDIESKQGRQLRTRVFVESTASPSGLHYFILCYTNCVAKNLEVLVRNFCVHYKTQSINNETRSRLTGSKPRPKLDDIRPTSTSRLEQQ